MKCFLTVLFWLPILAAQTVPDTYIVELNGEPVASRLARAPRRAGMRSTEAADMRAQVRAEQRTVRQRMVEEQVEVLDGVETVANALIVRVPETRAGRLASIAGVKGVHAVREFKMVLDRATEIHKAPEAWAELGAENAGTGIKIAIIDTGIDASHAAFQDPSLTPPDGFPRVNAESDLAFTNGKVIVARSYASLFSRRDPDFSARDHVGHGTAVGTAAAGVVNAGPMATIVGMAPKAYLGSYKVFGTPGVNDGASEAAILKAIDDAVNDGMQIMNLSLGSDLSPRLEDDILVQALERASSLGVLVVVAAGNNGPDVGTIGSPATAPSVIAVGASRSDRAFAASATVAGTSYVAIPGDGPNPQAVNGPIVDVASVDETALACSALPSGSLSGNVALILRGECDFEVKLINAQRAGAIGAVIYTDAARPDPIGMLVQSATLPAEMVSYTDGVAIKAQLSGESPLESALSFSIGRVLTSTRGLASFSTKGPNVDLSVKPELVATGTDIYTATQSFDPQGEMFSRDGYIDVDGTSFSSPLVAGAAALAMSAHPGLTVAQYRSLLIDSAAPALLAPYVPARVQQAGGGLLDAAAAVRSVLTATPAIVNFGAGGADPDLSRTLTLTNVGAAPETFLITVHPLNDSHFPVISRNTIELAPGESTAIAVTFSGSTLEAGAYEGQLSIRGSTNPVEMHVPYWYAVRSDTPAGITLLSVSGSGRAGASVRTAAIFRITDSAGVPITSTAPDASVVSGGGTVSSIASVDASVPGAYRLSVRLGLQSGNNVFRIQAGGVTRDIAIQGR